MQFNVLRDPWIPLKTASGVRLASYGDLLTGSADGEDIEHPRDDFSFFARMLLSALTQALLPAADTTELRQRIERPLSGGQLGAALAQRGFDLVGPGAFLQSPVGSNAVNETQRLFLDLPSGSNHLLFRPPHSFNAVCSSCAVIGLYGAQAFAPSGGRGKSPGVRGAPPLTTLVWLPSVRATAWANTLAQDVAAAIGYTGDPQSAWRQNAKQVAGNLIGLVEGLFWQPRAVELRPASAGACAACGRSGERLALFGFEAKSKVAGGFFRHPHSPARQDARPKAKRPWMPCYLRMDRPAWTGLADCLSIAQGRVEGAVIAHAAPVVSQWIERLGRSDVALLLLSYSTDKAKIRGRFSEGYALSMQAGQATVLETIRFLVATAETALAALERALSRARSSRGRGGFATDDAVAEFWRESEGPFWDALHGAQQGTDRIADFQKRLRLITLAIFDRQTELSVFDNAKNAPIAQARGSLARALHQLLVKEVARAA